MMMFCGDSHSRQFMFEGTGQFSYSFFSGATMKGLATINGRTGHRETVLHLVAAPRKKTVFLMFGNVDLDVTWYRKIIMGEAQGEEAFFEERAQALRDYLDECFKAGGKSIRKICVLQAQSPTLKDEFFFRMTPGMARIDEAAFVEGLRGTDTSHRERCRRTTRFNDYIAAALPRSERLEVFRIDDRMVDETGLIRDRYLRKNPVEHHAAKEPVMVDWYDRLQEEIPVYKKIHLRSQNPKAKEPKVKPGTGAAA